MSEKRVLVVDDEPAAAELFGMMLEREGYAVEVVHGTGAAIKAIQREKPDLLLLDVMMPGLSGLELCGYVRRDPDLREMPIVLISAKGQPEDVQAGLEAGATVYLAKPVSKSELLASIQSTLEQNR